MNPIRFLTFLVPLALLCSIACGAPEAKLRQEGGSTVVAPEQWFDLLIVIDPKGDPIDARSLQVDAGADGAVTFDKPIYPAPDAEGAFTKPFTVRVPTRLPDKAEHEVKIKVTAEDLEFEAKGTFQAGETRQHVKATAALKKPAVAGEPNAVVVKGSVVYPEYHVYGTQAEYGAPLEASLLPMPGTRGSRAWKAPAVVKPAGDELHEFSFEIPFTPVQAGKVDLRVLLNWSACTIQLCDPNELAYLPLSFEVKRGTGEILVPEYTDEAPVDKNNLASKGILELILLAIGGGLFALAMPCTYPLIPITISFFTKQAEARDGEVTGLALAYGGGIVAIFTLVGVVFGEPIIAFATLWWVNALFALLFLVFGLSLVGLFDISLPGFVNDLAAKASGTGGYLSVFAMGTTLVITSFTCTAPIIGLVLVFAAKGGSLAIVGMTMAVFGLTMAIPFVFLSLSPKAIQKMPRSGEWMKTLKVTLGIVELGLVLKFLSNVDLARGWFLIGRELFLVLWGASFLIAALYLLGVFSLFVPGAKWAIGRGRAIAGGILLVVTGYLASGVGGGLLYENLEAFLPVLPDAEHSYSDAFVEVVKEDYEAGVQVAVKRGAPIFLDFTGFQ